MMIALSFWALTLLCCSFAAVCGGRDGRRVAAIYVLGCFATAAAWYVDTDWSHPLVAIFAVDTVALLAFWRVALRSGRWFPLWVAGFQLVTVVSHIASFIAPGFAFKLYFFLESFWSVPMLLVLAAGVALDWRAGGVDEPPPSQGNGSG
jgi:hypothetical protein